MPRLQPEERERLRAIKDAGGQLSIVTHRHREAVPGSDVLHAWAEGVCKAGYLHLSRISGDRYNPAGERRYDYVLSEKGKRAAR